MFWDRLRELALEVAAGANRRPNLNASARIRGPKESDAEELRDADATLEDHRIRDWNLFRLLRLAACRIVSVAGSENEKRRRGEPAAFVSFRAGARRPPGH